MLKLCSAIMALGLSLSVSATELVIETWRVEDAKLWQEQILPSFHARYPDITVKLTPVPSSEYQTTVTQRLAEDKAGDLITCRPYDESLQLFQKGYLEDLTDLEGMDNFPVLPRQPGRPIPGHKPSVCRSPRSFKGFTTIWISSRSLDLRCRRPEPTSLP